MLQPVEEWLQGAAGQPDLPPWLGDKPAGWFDSKGDSVAGAPPAPPGQHSISEEDFALLEQFKRDRGEHGAFQGAYTNPFCQPTSIGGAGE